MQQKILRALLASARCIRTVRRTIDALLDVLLAVLVTIAAILVATSKGIWFVLRGMPSAEERIDRRMVRNRRARIKAATEQAAAKNKEDDKKLRQLQKDYFAQLQQEDKEQQVPSTGGSQKNQEIPDTGGGGTERYRDTGTS